MAQRDDLRVRGRIVLGDRPVVAGRDDLAARRRVAHDHRADRNLADQQRVLRLVERDAHRRFVGARRRIPVAMQPSALRRSADVRRSQSEERGPACRSSASRRRAGVAVAPCCSARSCRCGTAAGCSGLLRHRQVDVSAAAAPGIATGNRQRRAVARAERRRHRRRPRSPRHAGPRRDRAAVSACSCFLASEPTIASTTSSESTPKISLMPSLPLDRRRRLATRRRRSRG